MKKLTLWMSLFILCICSFLSHAQTLVNQDWITTAGLNNGLYDFQASHVIGSSGKIIVVGSTFHTGQNSNFLICEYTGDGNLIFKKEYDGLASADDFAVDVTTIGSSIYVTGVEGDTSAMTSYITTLKLDSVGDILSTWRYQNSYKKYNLGFRIIPDPSGSSVYVCGTSQTNVADFALTLLKYSTSGTQAWVSTYDSTGLYNAGVDMKVLGSALMVYGISGTSTTSGDIITRAYATSTGALISQSRINNTGAYVTKPVAIAKTSAEDIILTGISNDAGHGNDIVVIKLDSTLTLKWRKYIDGGYGGNDAVSAVKVDSKNNIIITGWASNLDTSKSIWTIKMKDSVIVWQKKRPCAIAGKDAKGFDMDMNTSNSIFVTGEVYNGTDFDQITLAYDSTGLPLFEKTFALAPSYDDQGRNIKIDSGGAILVYGRSNTDTGYTYSTMKYETFTKPFAVSNTGSGKPFCVQNRILIRFDTSAVIASALMSRDVKFGTPDKFLKTAVYNRVQNATGLTLSQCKLTRIIDFTPNDTISISRLGTRVPIPPFYAFFALDYIGAKTDETSVSNSLDTLFPTVVYSHPDYVGRKDGTNDSLYNLLQADLHPANGFDTANINIEPVWNTYNTTGQSFVRVGVIDDGLDYNNVDFGGAPYQTVKGGKDYTYSGSSIFSSPAGTGSHGTSVGGIVGALRNNTVGIAGIAGGDGTSGHAGVSMYGFRIYPTDTLTAVSYAVAAIAENATDSSTHPSNAFWGLNIMNNSYGFTPGDMAYKDSTILMLEDVVHFANRNQVTFVASRGNHGSTEIHCPSTFFDPWVVSVGASGNDGHHATNLLTTLSPITPNTECSGLTQNMFVSDYDKHYGVFCTDVIAPGSVCIAPTLTTGGGYNMFYGTSAAAPQASGVAALMMSMYNTSTPNFSNLTPEDVNGLMVQYAKRLPSVSYPDSLDAYGLLDAGFIFDNIWKPKYSIIHEGTYGVDTVKVDPTFTNQIGTIIRPVQNQQGHWFNIGNYKVTKYDVYKTFTVSPNPGSVVISTWPDHSLSDTWVSGFYGQPHVLEPWEQCDASETLTTPPSSLTSVAMTGSIYQISDSATGTYIGWLPYDSNFARHAATMRFSVLIDDQTISSIHETNIANYGLDARVYPNPSGGSNSISISAGEASQISIRLYDMEGRVLKTVYEGSVPAGDSKYNVNIGDLSEGVYFYRIEKGRNGLSCKFVKTGN